MERVTAFLVIFSTNFAIQSLPIENGFSVKFNPISLKEDLKPKQFGALFAKVPQDFRAQNEIRREALTKSYFPQKSDATAGFTNQVAKLLFPSKYYHVSNITKSWNHVNFLNLPIIRQPYDDYKILVATAPPNIHVGDNKRTLVYVIFPEDSTVNHKTEFTTSNMPTVYFVNERGSKMDLQKKGPVDPIFIVDNNRTVTGLKSKEIAKFVRFRNKWTHRYDYRITN